MDLKLIPHRSRFKVLLWILLVLLCLICSEVESWRITQKCPHGHYFNDGCTACWCDTHTGQTKCEKLPRCAGIQADNNEKCPRGRQFKDNCGNDCTCYESTGAVFCNEKRRCPQETIRNVVPIKIQTSLGIAEITENGFLRRGGQASRREDEPIRYRPSSTSGTSTTSKPYYHRDYNDRDRDYRREYSTEYPPRSQSGSSSTTRRPSVFEGVAVSSTPRPQIRLPGRSRSEELIIEPAIIIRKKGSNKANIVRNPSSATSVHLSSSRRKTSPGRGSFLFGGNKFNANSYYPSKPSSPQKPAPLNPLLLYEKQLKAIMDIKKAYAKILGSKVNFNFQLATGQVGNPTVTVQQTQSQQQSQKPAQNNGLLFIQNKMDNLMSSTTTDHPRRFDSEYLNSTILADIPTSTPYSQPLFPMNMNPPFFWQKEQIKNTLKQFSPVPPLQHLVSYVSSTTENYLSQFLNKYKNRNNLQISPETTTMNPMPPPPQPPVPPQPPQPNYFPSPQTFPSFQPQPQPPNPTPTPMPTLPPQIPSYSTIQPQFQEEIPIHQVYQSHPLKNLLPPHLSQVSQNYNYNYNPPQYQYPNPTYHPPPPSDNSPPHFPFVSEIIHELAQNDNLVPTATPRSSPALTALPTFQTPGPPYAEVDVVQPLSFLPPPQPEPPTPTRRIFNIGGGGGGGGNHNNLRPTVRVNLDKPIFVPPSPSPSSPQGGILQNRYPHPPQHPPPQHSPHHFFFNPFQQNRRIHFRPPRPPPPPPPQHHYSHGHHPHPPPRFNSFQPQFFMPRPKQYRLVLKGPMREAATRMDQDVVPNFVQKIAQEFFKKPEIYVPKIRPGKPLTLEKIVLNHKEIVPQEVMFTPTTPGSIQAQAPMTKLRFTPDAQWQMREELAKHGVILNEPVTNPIRDYALSDPNIMEMDAPIESIQTWETHTGMGMGVMQEPQQPNHVPTDMMVSGGTIQQTPSPFTPSATTMMMDNQHQQELQRQVLMAQQQQQQNHQTPQFSISSSPPPLPPGGNDDAFTINPLDFNDFHQQQQQMQNIFPSELNNPGVQEVVVDKYLVHDPNDPQQPYKVYSTTTVRPAAGSGTGTNVNPHRNGLPQATGQTQTAAPSVLIRHHGAPSSTSTSTTLEPPSPTSTAIPMTPFPVENIMVTFINSTPQPQMVTTTISPLMVDMPPQQLQPMQTGNIADQIQEFLTDQMDFGARPQMDLFDVLFKSRTGAPEIVMSTPSPSPVAVIDQVAAATRSGEHGHEEEKEDVETDKLASIFSLDYKSKYNRKPPEVIVIKVPPEHSDGPFPKVVEKRKGAEIEIQGGSIKTSANSKSDGSLTESSTEKLGEEIDTSVERYSEINSSSKRTRNRKRKKKRRKKGKRNRNRSREPEYDSDGGNVKSSDNDNDNTTEINSENDKSEESTTKIPPEDPPPSPLNPSEAEEKFNQELDWKSKLMANICELNPSSPLCLTYRSICLLMTSDDS